MVWETDLEEELRFTEAQQGLGTQWVTPGQGSTWRELYDAFGNPLGIHGAANRHRPFSFPSWDDKTNLLLTGQPITATDRQRWESGKVE